MTKFRPNDGFSNKGQLSNDKFDCELAYYGGRQDPKATFVGPSEAESMLYDFRRSFNATSFPSYIPRCMLPNPPDVLTSVS